MDFICIELEEEVFGLKQIDVIPYLLKKTASVGDTYSDTDGVYNQVAKTLDDAGKNLNIYEKPAMVSWFNASFDVLADVQTIAEFETLTGVSITDNLSNTDDFHFQVNKLINLRSDYWYTVFDADGVYFYKPTRKANAHEYRIDASNINGNVQKQAYLKDVNYEGETGTNYTIAPISGNITPAAVDNALKVLAVNKFRSRENTIIATFNIEPDLLDIFVYEGVSHVIMSKKTIAVGKYQIIAVREVTDDKTVTTADSAMPITASNAARVGGIDIQKTKIATIYRNTSVQAIATGALRTVEFNAELDNTDASYFTSYLTTPTWGIKVLKSGWYSIDAFVDLSAFSAESTHRIVILSTNDGQIAKWFCSVINGKLSTIGVSKKYYILADDIIYVQTQQNTGSDVNLLYSGGFSYMTIKFEGV